MNWRTMGSHQFTVGFSMSHGNHQVRIISGKWRGRKLQFPKGTNHQDLRPTTDRIRETVFNWIAPYVQDAVCLDAFAGSGALGWEALSRHAQHVHFVDASADVRDNLHAQQATLTAHEHSTIVLADAIKWLQQPASQRFDLVFLDPPFRLNTSAQTCLDALVEQQWLSPGALVYVEQDRNDACVDHVQLKRYRHQQAGQVQYTLFTLDRV
ncbi:MAG: 16S rRNA (guanine(966)-N(2))-methyltransferase RsmD [Pseudomonadota bacterium]